jgi:pimeloyl-ACP methyl ester carboxylesterase/protein-tyrosine phosphatase
MSARSEQASRLGSITAFRLQNLFASITTQTFQYGIATSLAVLVPCIVIVRKQVWTRSSKSGKEDASPGEISDTIGTGMFDLLTFALPAAYTCIDAITTDPSLLKKFSSYSSYSPPATGYTYPSIRTFYREHPQGDKLPTDPAPIPLLVFIHGLGGSVAQFHTLLTSLTNCADTLAIDLPGCGLSRFSPYDWDAYTTKSLVHLLADVIEKYRKNDQGQGVILICHSMGCSLGALLSSSTSPYNSLISEHVEGMIAICPVAEPPTEVQVKQFRKFLHIPGTIFDLWRRWDRRGGTESASVARFTGFDAEPETKKLQVRYNEQSRTPVWRRMAYGSLPDYVDGRPQGGLPGKAIWSGLRCSVFLVAGEADPITKAENVEKIAAFLGHAGEVVSAASLATGQGNAASESSETRPTGVSVFKALVLPAPASHALVYAPRTARPLAGHIQSFLTQVDHRLSLGWQLQYLSEGGKWDVKNLTKWQGVEPVSKPIDGLFRAMKTLREVDPSHSPKVFVQEWSSSTSPKGKDGLGPIAAVVDISHETPVYDMSKLEEGGIAYRKFPTVSKLPPTVDEVKSFIEVVDNLREELQLLNASGGAEDRIEKAVPPHALIAVHCHYGFNRTGFFIIAYMVEKLDWRLTNAIEEFAKARPRGVRHSYFVDELYARYWTRDQSAK